ncbi:MAG: hypothetical protein L6420_09155 [Elusimicrobia bacterium]|nr:hypothetical protein [Elusimicrobiota bacterium]
MGKIKAQLADKRNLGEINMSNNKINLKIVMAIFFITSLNSITYAERYKSKILIKSEWGSDANQFGIYKKAIKDGYLGSIRGPVAMDVDKKGNIYIYDPINWRINIYANNGKYKGTIKLENDAEEIRGVYGFSGGYALKGRGGDEIRVDDANNIYLYTGNKNPYMLRKFNRKGDLTTLYIDKYRNTEEAKSLRKKDKFKRINNYFKKLEKKNKLKLGYNSMTLLTQSYIPVEGYIDGALLNKVPSYYNNKRKKRIKIFLCPGWTKKFLPKVLKQKIETNSQYKDVRMLFADDTGYIEKSLTAEGDLISEDIQGNLYFLVSDWIYKYNSNGSLIDKVELTMPSGEDKPIPYISWNGDVYQIFWENNKLEDGFQLIRWKIE